MNTILSVKTLDGIYAKLAEAWLARAIYLLAQYFNGKLDSGDKLDMSNLPEPHLMAVRGKKNTAERNVFGLRGDKKNPRRSQSWVSEFADGPTAFRIIATHLVMLVCRVEKRQGISLDVLKDLGFEGGKSDHTFGTELAGVVATITASLGKYPHEATAGKPASKRGGTQYVAFELCGLNTRMEKSNVAKLHAMIKSGKIITLADVVLPEGFEAAIAAENSSLKAKADKRTARKVRPRETSNPPAAAPLNGNGNVSATNPQPATVQ